MVLSLKRYRRSLPLGRETEPSSPTALDQGGDWLGWPHKVPETTAGESKCCRSHLPHTSPFRIPHWPQSSFQRSGPIFFVRRRVLSSATAPLGRELRLRFEPIADDARTLIAIGWPVTGLGGGGSSPLIIGLRAQRRHNLPMGASLIGDGFARN